MDTNKSAIEHFSKCMEVDKGGATVILNLKNYIAKTNAISRQQLQDNFFIKNKCRSYCQTFWDCQQCSVECHTSKISNHSWVACQIVAFVYKRYFRYKRFVYKRYVISRINETKDIRKTQFL